MLAKYKDYLDLMEELSRVKIDYRIKRSDYCVRLVRKSSGMPEWLAHMRYDVTTECREFLERILELEISILEKKLELWEDGGCQCVFASLPEGGCCE